MLLRDRAPLLLPAYAPAAAPPESPLHDAIRGHLAAAGASFWPDLQRAAAGTGGAGGVDDDALLNALWDLVWSGEVTNDTLAPLRASRRAGRSRAPRRRPQVGRLTRLGPPAGAGRWSLVATLGAPARPSTEHLHALAVQLLERHGVVTREAVAAEGVAGGFAGIYPVLKAMEEAGRVRRGYFVAGLGAAQFALPGAVDRLRGERHPPDTPVVRVLAAADPAQPYGAALAWPAAPDGARLARAAGAYAVLVDGALAAYLERSGRVLRTFLPPTDDADWLDALVAAAKDGRLPRLVLERVDDEPARRSPLADRLRAAGFADGYKGLTLRG